MRTAQFLILGALALAGCASLEPADADGEATPAAATGAPETETATETGTTAAPARKKAKPRWKGAKATHYRNAYRVCSVFTPKEIARNYGVKAKPKPAARAHARRLYPTKHFRPAFQGCLDGFAGRAPRA